MYIVFADRNDAPTYRPDPQWATIQACLSTYMEMALNDILLMNIACTYDDVDWVIYLGMQNVGFILMVLFLFPVSY